MVAVLFLLLVVIGTNAQLTASGGLYPPYYVQARNAFAQARLFLQESVPPETRDFRNPEARKHFSFGILAGVTMALVEAFDSETTEYMPLEVLQESVPYAWENYTEVSRTVNNILAEANAWIEPITSLIDSLCMTTYSVEECNLRVHEQVIKLLFLRHRAGLLLQLGKAARIFNRNAKLLDLVAAANGAVPYLFQHVDTTPFEIFIAELTRAYDQMQPESPIAHRRSYLKF